MSERLSVSLPRVIVFLRSPELGKVKTRLAATVGPERALAVHRQLMELTLAALRSVPEVTLCVTPDSAVSSRDWPLQPGWSFVAQGEGDLGRRLERSFAASFAVHSQPLVVIGCDCPDVTPADMMEAGRLLTQRDVVFGPATDGGYWLIGLRRPAPELFSEIPWGSDQVLAASVKAAQAAGLTVGYLRELSDIDTEADWQAWVARGASPQKGA